MDPPVWFVLLDFKIRGFPNKTIPFRRVTAKLRPTVLNSNIEVATFLLHSKYFVVYFSLSMRLYPLRDDDLLGAASQARYLRP